MLAHTLCSPPPHTECHYHSPECCVYTWWACVETSLSPKAHGLTFMLGFLFGILHFKHITTFVVSVSFHGQSHSQSRLLCFLYQFLFPSPGQSLFLLLFCLGNLFCFVCLCNLFQGTRGKSFPELPLELHRFCLVICICGPSMVLYGSLLFYPELFQQNPVYPVISTKRLHIVVLTVW